jgi:FkbM family methyltransferase
MIIAGDENLHIDMTVKERNVKFDLTYDPGFIADVCTKRFLEHNGACEPDTVHVMRRVIKPGDFVIDGGANIGFFTMLMSRLVGEQGHVEAFEPATVNFKKLRNNLELNKVENVTAINRALWSDDADLTLYISQDTGLCSLMPFEFSITTLPVRVLTLDRWCAGYDQRPRLIKLDIEGSEERALIGAARMLQAGVDFIVTEINERALSNFGSSQADLRHYMKSKGYDMFWMHEDGLEPTLVTDDQVLEGAENMNALFSKPEIVRNAWETPLS